MEPNAIREYRQAAKLSLERLAEMAEMSVSQLSRIERGQRQPTLDNLRKLAKALRAPISKLARERTVHAVGYVGAGAEIIPVDDHAVGAGMEEVELPPGVPDDAVLVIVKGDSMYPRYFDGEYLFYVRDSRPAAELTGRECVVKLADGRMFVKMLRRGARVGLFNLESWNAPLLEDQAVEWAAPVMARVNRQSRR
jgi:transcriptional regulator with XRE-family HTH domain